MLGVTDSAFQPQLLAQAQRSGKLERDFAIPAAAAHNTIARIETALGPARRDGLLPDFPLGSDMNQTEEALVGPLLALKTASKGELLRMVLAGWTGRVTGPDEIAALDRLGLATPKSFVEHAERRLILGALRQKPRMQTRPIIAK